MIVTTGGRGRRSSSRSSSASSKYFAWSSASCSSPGSTSLDRRTDLSGEELDHVVGERLGGGDHLALEEKEADHVAGRTIQLWTELASRGSRSTMTSVSGTGALEGVYVVSWVGSSSSRFLRRLLGRL